jgi:hypothetical protein
MYKTRRLSLICLLALLTAGAAGQKNVQSPFARYGIGNLEQQGTFRTMAMGGISSGIRNNLTLNYVTPASYSSIDTASFIFDFGLDYGVIRLSEGDQSFWSQDLNFSHLLLGFPVMKGWGVTAGVMPYSNGSYQIIESASDAVGTEDLLERHTGSGGYQKALIGTGFSPVKYFSAGVNLFFIFGEITRLNDLVFTEDNNYFNTRKFGSSAMNGIGWEASVQFMAPLPEKKYINAGITYTPSLKLNTTNREVIFRYSSIQTSNLAFDTLYNATVSTTSRIPQTIRAGITFGQNDKFTAGADIVYTTWTKASLPGAYGTYSDVISLHAGAEFIPDKFSNYSFFDRVEYRAGCRYGESYALYGGDNVKEYGITFGTGIPMRRSRSRISLVVDLSKRGNPDSGIPGETRISIGASLNLYDYWFLKRQYE